MCDAHGICVSDVCELACMYLNVYDYVNRHIHVMCEYE